MNPDTSTVEQRTDEWYEARLGKATASRFKDILATNRDGSKGAAYRNYKAQLLVERLTGQQAERFKTGAMEWGIETEDLARLTYSMKTGRSVNPVGFVQHQFLMAGASGDGMIDGEPGGIEIKCFNTANHIEALRRRQMPEAHRPQVQGQMWIGELDYVDFISFEPTLPDNAQMFIQRIFRDEAYIANLAVEVAIFLEDVDEDEKFIKQYKDDSDGR